MTAPSKVIDAEMRRRGVRWSFGFFEGKVCVEIFEFRDVDVDLLTFSPHRNVEVHPCHILG